MISRILEIQSPGNYLSVSRGHLVISKDKIKVGSVPLTDVGVLLISNLACSLSATVLSALLGNGAQIIVCDEAFQPAGVFLPINKMLKYSERMDLQINASLPLKKNLWAKVVEQKIRNQAFALEVYEEDASPLWNLIPKIKSGDTSNIEAQAARIYWPLLMGADFKRRQNEDGLNALLNYGYTVLRASMARAIVSTGISPSFSLHHSSKENPAALIDDLMCTRRNLI